MSECEHGKLIIPDLVQTAIKSVRKSKSVTAHAHHLSFHDYDVITKPFREALTQRVQKIERLQARVAKLEAFVEDVTENWPLFCSSVWRLVNTKGIKREDDNGWMPASRLHALLKKHGLDK